MLAETLQGFELSPQQRRLWSLVQKDGESVYRSRYTVTVHGEFDRGILTAVLRKVVERHELLRTRFRLLPGMSRPLQVVSPDPEFHYLFDDLAALPPSDRETRLGTLLERGVGAGSDPPNGPPLRVTHFALGDTGNALSLELPAFYADAYSMHVLWANIRMAYKCLRDGNPMPELPVQYADIAQTLNECILSDEFDFARGLWRDRLAKSTVRGRLPFEPSTAPFRPQQIGVPLTRLLRQSVGEFCARAHVSRASVLLACWGLLMCRIQAAEEILIGLCCDGRTYAVLRESIGPLARHVPVVFHARHSDSFEEVARAADVLCGQIIQEQHYFDPSASSETSDNAPLDHGPAFEYLLLSGNTCTQESLLAPDFLFSIVDRFAIKFIAIEDDKDIYCRLDYDASTIPETDPRRLAQCFATLLGSALRDPGRSARLLDVVGSEERHSLLTVRGPEAKMGQICIHDLFERQALERPDSVALVCQDHQLSYEKVNRQANKLAQYICRLGVGREARVGLCLERREEMVIGLLGILKAGGAYLPLEPSHPATRLVYMLENARATLLIASCELPAGLPAIPVLRLDSGWELINQCTDATPEVTSAPENLAYVIYTSGSTGRPKGVGIEHRQLVNYVTAIGERLKLAAGCRMALISTFAADLGHTMLYPSLCFGGELHVVPEDCGRDKEMWRRYQTEREIDCIKMTPTHLQTLVDGKTALPRRQLVLGGELCSLEWVRKVHAWVPECEVHNHYGPTECTVGAVSHCVHGREETIVPIGTPLGNVRIHVIDELGEPVVLSVPGELYIGGSGVGRGYLNDAGQTAERFVPDEWSGDTGGRLYRTGDLVKRRPDGELEYLGRHDEQVKLRGYRIELGEIQSVIAEHPRVRHCVVQVREDVGGRLVAYLVPADKTGPPSSELREFLLARLPEYMVPSTFVEVSELPLTPNGKLDQQRLPPPNAVETPEEDQESPTPLEEIIQGIFAEVLIIETVGPHTSFFDLGGHSLLATLVVSRIRDVLGVEIPLRALFENPTVARLTAIVEQDRAAGKWAPAPPIASVGRHEALPLSFAQQRLWFLDRLAPGGSVYNIAEAFRFIGHLNIHALEDGLSETVRRHEVLRTTFDMVDGRPVQLIAEPRSIRLPLVDLSNVLEPKRESQTQRLAAQESQRPFDLARGPHIRGQILRVGEEDHVLLFTMHHIVADGWSMRLLILGVTTLYEAFSHGEPSRLPELAIQYADFAVWQRAWLTGSVLEGQLGFWKRQLDNLTPLAIVTDRPRPAQQSYRGQQHEKRISDETAVRVKGLSRREGVTLFMTFLAVLNVLLHHETGQEDLVTGTDVANRNRGQVEGLIGFFVNQLVIRVDVSGNPTFNELLRRVREVALDAYAHQDLPFEKLVEVLKPDRMLGQSPLFQVKLIVQNGPDLNEPGARASRAFDRNVIKRVLGAELSNTSHLDMILILRDTPSELVAQLRYSTELFDGATASRFLSNFETILDAVVIRPDTRLSELVGLIDVADQQDLINRRNRIKHRRRHRFESSAAKLLTT
jgi:amino acid adenylation domain-containing protein